MRAVGSLLAVLVALPAWGFDSGVFPAPSYSESSVVNAASFEPGVLAPYSLVSLHGKHLAYVTRGLSTAQLQQGSLNYKIAGTGVTVSLGAFPMYVVFVSPERVDFLVPPDLVAQSRPATLVYSLNARCGPEVKVRMVSAAPALVQRDDSTVLATHDTGGLVSEEDPARPGEWISIYATGLGVTSPMQPILRVAPKAAQIKAKKDLKVLLDGVPVDAESIGYAGVLPGVLGMYRVEVRVPEVGGKRMEIALLLNGRQSQSGLALPGTGQ